MSVTLSLNEVCDLENKPYHTLYRRVKRNNLKADKVETENGVEYRVKLENLSTKAQKKYTAMQKTDSSSLQEYKEKVEQDLDSKYNNLTMDDLSEKQKQQVDYWVRIIDEWQRFILPFPKQKTEKTKDFLKIFNFNNTDQLSERTLRRKYSLYRKYGETALADDRSLKRASVSSIDEKVWSIFLSWWLDEAKPTTSHIRKLVEGYLTMKGMNEFLPIPSLSSFNRAIQKLPVGVVTYFREGDKALTDEVLLYIMRVYDTLESNQMWTSDYHTLDMFVKDDLTGKVFRPHLVVWADIRSRKMLSLDLYETSSSAGVISTFRRAVEKFGIPENVYLDNGKEYLVSDFGGRGKRKSSSNANYGTGILDRLGIKMMNARVRNGRAKAVERSFKQVADEFSRLFITYCGNRPGTRPERHKDIMKDDANIPLLSEVKKDLEAYIEGWYNLSASSGDGMNGKCPNEVYAENLIIKKIATQEQLNELLLRSTRTQKVTRNGVHVTIGAEKVWFYNTELVVDYFGKSVYIRYNPDNLSTVRVYDEDERFLIEVESFVAGGYDMDHDVETIKKVQRFEREHRKHITDFKKNVDGLVDAGTARETLIAMSKQNIANDNTIYDAPVVQPFAFEKQEYQKVAGAEEIVDIGRMVENARRNKEEE